MTMLPALAHHFHVLFYVTHLHGHKVWVDVSGDAWRSKADAIRSSHHLLAWLAEFVGRRA